MHIDDDALADDALLQLRVYYLLAIWLRNRADAPAESRSTWPR
ncbi:MAG: hypothetical protein U0168_18400 [Nannocystaceae bacterium]